MSEEELEAKFEEAFGEKVEEEVEVEEKTEQEEFSKTCPECGANVDDDLTACPECGKDITEVPENEDDKDDFEVEEVEYFGKNIDKIVTCKITKIEKHKK